VPDDQHRAIRLRQMPRGYQQRQPLGVRPMRFRVDLRNERAGRYPVLVDGRPRGIVATQDRGYWSAAIVDVPLIQGLWSHESLERWLSENIDAGVLAPRPDDTQTEMEL